MAAGHASAWDPNDDDPVGGPDLDVLFVTTATQKGSTAATWRSSRWPALLAVEVGVGGLAEARYAG